MTCSCKKVDTSSRAYFSDYTDLEKKLIIQNLGLTGSNITITNLPDNEDLTQVTNGNQLVLKFKDKTYNPDNWSGYGKVILRKNLVTDNSKTKNILTQSMFLDENNTFLDHTIFIIQYDFDLNGKFIQLPSNSILIFDGGSLVNGTLVLNSAKVLPQGLEIDKYILCSTSGDYSNGQLFYKNNKLIFKTNDKWFDITGVVTVDALTSEITSLNAQVKTLTDEVAVLEKNSTVSGYTLMSQVPTSINFNITDKVSTDGKTAISIDKLDYGTKYRYFSEDGNVFNDLNNIIVEYINCFNNKLSTYTQDGTTFIGNKAISTMDSIQLKTVVNNNYRLYISTTNGGTIASPIAQTHTTYTYTTENVLSNIVIEVMSQPIFNFNSAKDVVQIGLSLSFPVTSDGTYEKPTCWITFYKTDSYVQSVSVTES